MSIHLRSLICPLAGERRFSTQECKITRTTVTNKVPAFIAMTGHTLRGSARRYQHLMKESDFWLNTAFVLIVPEETIQPRNVEVKLLASDVVTDITLQSANKQSHQNKKLP